MDVTNQKTSYQQNLQFLSHSYTSKKDFVREYKKFYHDKIKAEELYLQILIEFEKAVVVGNIDRFKSFCTIIGYIKDIESKVTLKIYYDNPGNPIKNTNPIILACKYNKVDILKFIFNNNKILDNFFGFDTIAPDDADGTTHNAFYYAICSKNIELLATLIDKWPGDFFANHLEELDSILSKAYEEIKLKNILLSDIVEFFVQSKLINLHFFSKDSGNVQNSLTNIRDRIRLVLETVHLLNSDNENVDERFLFTLKFLAQNIHILKRQLKSTYNRLPWEEIEFCLVCFVSSHVKQQEINLFYHTTLNKSRILNHLINFAIKLKQEDDNIEGMDISKLAVLPTLKREKIVSELISNYPQFEDLYIDFQQIRDVHSLEMITNYTELALSADPKVKEGQLIITRTIQVIGECLKNTLESPKLSKTTSELLLLSLSRNTREVIIDLRNSLSHVYSLSKRAEIDKNTDVNFFTGIQNDTKKINGVVTNILYKYKIKIITEVLKKIMNSEDFFEIRELSKTFNNVKFNEKMMGIFTTNEHEKLEKLFKELSISVTEKTSYEKELFNKINTVINFEKTKLENIKNDYIMGFDSLMSVGFVLRDNEINNNFIRIIKFHIKTALKNIAPKIETESLKEIANLTRRIFNSVNSRLQVNSLDDINRLVCEIFYAAEFGIDSIKWIEDLREKLNTKGFILEHKQRKSYKVTKETYNNQLKLKLSELKSILTNNGLSNQLIEKFRSYRNNKKLQAVVEMLVLDITSILDDSMHCLDNNLFLLDDNFPLLTGKCLRNHLAHDNVLFDILTDPSIAIISNADKLSEENLIEIKKKIGRLVKNNLSKVKNKFDRSVDIITNQNNMFVVLEEGNLEGLKTYLNNGADIHARSINLSTTLHFAAKGSSLEIIKFLLDQNVNVNAKDTNGRSPLHIAVANGCTNIVKFFIEDLGLYIGDVDNAMETPLHIAAQNGHKPIVKVLLKNKANTFTKNVTGLSPVYCAIRNNHIQVVKVLLEEDTNVDVNEVMGGFTLLHQAAEHGHLEILNFLIKKKSNVNAKNERNWTPLHAAALNGHLEVAKALVLKGGNVNIEIINGCTPLHYAVENGHEKIADLLLEHGANVNVVDKTYNNTPLHYAAQDGHEGILNTLLKNKANPCVVTIEGLTPLHCATQNGHLGIVIALLKHGVDINAINRNNRTPLCYAAEGGHTEIARLLIRNKAKVDAKGDDNFTPLHLAAQKGHKDIMDLLIENKAEINIRANNGFTPLHTAVMNGSIEVVDLLIGNRAQVNARANNDSTPLHMAAFNGSINLIELLINNKAEINAGAKGITPLHVAVLGNNKYIIDLLIKNGAQVNARDISENTPLHQAVEVGCKKVIEILIANGAYIDAMNKNNQSPLFTAIKHNNKEIVKILIKNGANVNINDGEPLSIAVFAGFRDIVEILLKSKAKINIVDDENTTLLHIAAKKGHKAIVNILIANDADVRALNINKVTPLYFAAQEGHDEVVKILVQNTDNINKLTSQGTPLHIAAGCGHNNVVEVLLNNGADVNIRDNKHRTPAEIAVARGHLLVVKALLEHEKSDVHAKSNDAWTMLHIAAQEGNLELTRYLVEKGVNINSRNTSGSKPIHIAARDGYRSIVEYFIGKGLSINDLGAASQSLLHYSAIQDKLEVAEYLIKEGINVNTKDANGQTPLHIAATYSSKDVIEILLKNGAIYNNADNFNNKPLEMTKDRNIINLLGSTDKLFEAVKHNSSLDIKNLIEAGASVNAKNSSGTPLHYAAWKGYEEVVQILLQNRANPNLVANKGFSPLHYAAKFSQLKVVKALLSKGAIYNIVSESGKIPLDFAVDEGVASLLKLINECFINIINGDSKIIKHLNKIQDFDIVKAVMNARNRENKSLVVTAIVTDFPKIEQLKEVLQNDVSARLHTAKLMCVQEKYQEGLNIYRSVFEKRRKILGPENPGTLDIQGEIAKILYKQQNYREALNIYTDVYQKQIEVLGINNTDALRTRNQIALILHRQGKEQEALNIYEEICQKQTEILGTYHSDTLDSLFHMALVLDKQKKYEEALKINYEVFEKRKIILGPNHQITLSSQNNIAMVLCNKGDLDEALKIYEEVYKRRREILGPGHSDTLRTLHNKIGVLHNQKKYDEALKAYKEIFDIQKTILGSDHLDTLNTQSNMASLLLTQGKFVEALKNFNESIDKRKTILGTNHPDVLQDEHSLELINHRFRLEDSSSSEVLQYLQKNINIAANNGEVQTIQSLLDSGVDVNDKDVDGRTPLYYAIDGGQIEVINFLLKNGANIIQLTNKGNTPLHTAVTKGNKEIVEVLLQHVSRNKLNDFIDVQTTVGGSTALHVAAKNGFLEIVKFLLKHCATYNIKNKDSKTPLDVSKDQSIISLLKLIGDLFEDAKNDNIGTIKKLNTIKPGELEAATNARNDQGYTALRVAIVHGHKKAANKLLEMLKK